MAKLPLITVVAPETGPAKITAIPKVEGGDSKGYYDSDTGKVVVADLVIDSLGQGILKTDVDGNVSSNATIGHAEVEGLGGLALVDAVALGSNEATGVLPTGKGGTGKGSVTAGALLLGAGGNNDMTELVGDSNGHVVKWNSFTNTWYSAAESGGGGGGGSVDTVTGTSPITVDNTDPANPVVGINQSALSIANTQVTGLGSLATQSSVSLTSDVTGTLPAGSGGTGLGAPSSGNAGKVLTAKSDGTYELATPATGTVHSVTAASGSPITVSNTDPANPVVDITQSALSIAHTQVSGLGSLATKSAISLASGSSDYTGTLPAGNQAAQNMGGDVSGTTASATVAKIQGNAVATGTPANGQVLTWSTALSQWVPGANTSGGSGGGGVTLFFNNQTNPTTPTTNLRSGTKQMGRSATDTLNSIGPVALTKDAAYLTVASFVTDHTDKYTTIAAGLWDFNVWVQGDSGQSPTQTQIRIRIFAYDESTDPTAGTAIGVSDDVYMYDPTVAAQYPIAVMVPQTTLSPAQRLYIDISARTTATQKHVTVFFGGNEASHVHTTIPAVTGTGLYKLVDGVPQSPASYLVDADVDVAAAIDQSKISGLTTSLAGKVDTTRKVLGDGTTTSQSSTGALSADVTISMKDISAAKSNLGSASKTVTISTDTYGRVTGLAEQSISILSAAVTDLSSNTVTSLTGTNNQITVSGGSTGALTLSLPSTISWPNAATATSVSITAGAATGSNAVGGNFTITAGAATSGNANGGSVTINPGAKVGTGTNGDVNIGAANTNAVTLGNTSAAGIYFNSGIRLNSANADIRANSSGLVPFIPFTGGTSLTLQGKSVSSGTATSIVWQGGGSSVASGTAGNLTLSGGVSTGVTSIGGNLFLTGGSGTLTNGSISIGASSTSSIGIGAAGVSTTFTGTVTIPAGASISGYAPIASPTFTGTVTTPDLTLTNLTASRVLKLDADKKVSADYIRNTDVASDAAIDRDKLAAGVAVNALVVNNATDKKLSELAISTTAGHVLKSDGTAAAWASVASLLPANVALLDGASQTFSNKVTFSASSAPIALTGLTSSLPLKLDASGNVKSEAIALGGSEVSGVLAAAKGGTGFGTGNTYTIGDILYADGTTSLAKLAAVTAGNVLISKGTGIAPEWNKVGLTTHVTGTLGFGNGGVGADLTSAGETYGVVFKSSSSALSVTAAGSANTFLKSGAGSAGPSFVGLTATDIAGITPYDISGEAVGSVAIADVVMRFFASRDCTVKAGTYTGARCVTAPSGSSATFNIKKTGGGTAIGTITFASGSNAGTISIASDVPLAGGTDYLTVECTAANGIATPWFTIKGTA